MCVFRQVRAPNATRCKIVKMKSRTWQLNSTLFAYAVRTFLTGVEAGVILPSVWLYLQMFHAAHWYFGLVLSAYSVVPVATAILVGHIFDKNRVNIRVLGLSLNVAEVYRCNIFVCVFAISFMRYDCLRLV